MTNCLFSYIKRKNVYFLSGCCFTVLELLGVGFSVCYCQFLFCQLPCSKDQFHRLCAPFYRSEYQKYLKLKKKKSCIISAGKGLLVCASIYAFVHIYLFHTLMCIFLYLHVCIYTHTKISKYKSPCYWSMPLGFFQTEQLCSCPPAATEWNTTQKNPSHTCPKVHFECSCRSWYKLFCVCPFLLPKLFTLHIKSELSRKKNMISSSDHLTGWRRWRDSRASGPISGNGNSAEGNQETGGEKAPS